MKVLFLLFCLAAFPAALFSQNNPAEYDAPSRLLFAPLIAHHVEPRVGMSRLIEEERLRLDIGNSIDLLSFDGFAEGDRAAVGADFFTWTSLRQEASFHFPVDAVDYLFGINASYLRPLNEHSAILLRLRLSHISAHLVDGSYDKTEAAWREGDLPQVYSREFLDLVAAWEYGGYLRVYAGGQYIYHIDPADLGKLGLQSGIEAVWRDAPVNGLHLYAAYDLRLVDNGALRSAHGLQVGAKLGAWRGSGVKVFIAYYHGPSQHGEYYDRMWSYWGPGLNVDF